MSSALEAYFLPGIEISAFNHPRSLRLSNWNFNGSSAKLYAQVLAAPQLQRLIWSCSKYYLVGDFMQHAKKLCAATEIAVERRSSLKIVNISYQNWISPKPGSDPNQIELKAFQPEVDKMVEVLAGKGVGLTVEESVDPGKGRAQLHREYEFMSNFGATT